MSCSACHPDAGDGASWGRCRVSYAELLIGGVYDAIGLTAIRLFEHLSRAGATLDRICGVDSTGAAPGE